jgi:hypothetical protein
MAATRSATPVPSADAGWANPAAIGLLGFGLTTMVTGLANTGNLGVGLVPVLGLALVFGGMAQLIAGFVALYKGEIFAGTAFVSYGAFWMAVFAMNTYIPASSSLTGGNNGMLAFWGVWTLVTITFVINAPKHGLGVSATFFLLIIAFLLLDANAWMVANGHANANFAIAMGWEIFATGLVAWLTATAVVTNANYGRRILPL